MDRYRLHTTGYGIAPGFIHEERLGARIIDDVLVTETGAEILSRYTRDRIIIQAPRHKRGRSRPWPARSRKSAPPSISRRRASSTAT